MSNLDTEKPSTFFAIKIPKSTIKVGDSAEKELSDLETERVKAAAIKNANARQNIELRKLYAKLTFGLVCLWMISVMVLVYFDGFLYKGFNLPTSVLITLLSTTTADIVGFLTLIYGYLFKDTN